MIFYFVKKLLQRSYKFLLLTFFSLAIGAFLFGGALSLTSGVTSFLRSEGKTLVGGDIVLQNAYPILTSSEELVAMTNKGHTVTREQQVQAVFRATAKNTTSPANLRIVESSYPLYGKVTLADKNFFSLTEGGVYVEQAFLKRMQITVGDTVQLGNATLQVLGVILKEPDTVSLGISFTPRVIILESDFKKTGLDLAESRTSYKVFIKENTIIPLTKNDVQYVQEYAKKYKLRFDDATDGPNRLIRGVSSVSTFVGIIIMISLFLVTVNTISNLTYVFARFKKTIALLKTFGATNLQIQIIYVCILGLVGGIAGAFGSLLGVHMVSIYIPQLSLLTAATLVLPPKGLISLYGGLFGMVCIFSMAIPFFASLRSILPKELLSGVSQKVTGFSLRTLCLFLPVPIFLAVLLYGLSKDVLLTMYSVGGLILLFTAYVGLSYFIIETTYRYRSRFPFIVRSTVSFLKWRGLQTLITTASIMIAFSGVFIITTTEHTITQNLRQNISTKTPSLYLVDIKKNQVEQVRTIVGSTFKEYPIIRGRLLSLNEKDLTLSENREITREFNITYRDSLIEGERVIEGVFNQSNEGRNTVSIDKNFGEDLGGVKLGDSIIISIQGVRIEATIGSIREVESTRGTPFFYLVYPPSVLSSFPSTYFATAHIEKDNMDELLLQLALEFQNIVPIETRGILESLSTLISSIIFAVTLMGVPSIFLGLMLTLVMMWQSLYERKADVLVLRAFGLHKRMITALFCLEAGVIVLVSGVLAYIVASGIAYLLSVYVFSFDTFSFSLQPLFMIAGSILLVIIFSFFITRSIVNTSLKNLLAEK